jgi:hypothetical protein
MHPYITTHTLPSYIAPALHQPAPPPLATAPTKCVAPRRDSSNGRRGNQHVTTAKWRDVARRGGARQHERRRYTTEVCAVCMRAWMPGYTPPPIHPVILHTSYLPAYLLPTCLPHTYLPTSYLPVYLLHACSMRPHMHTHIHTSVLHRPRSTPASTAPSRRSSLQVCDVDDPRVG